MILNNIYSALHSMNSQFNDSLLLLIHRFSFSITAKSPLETFDWFLTVILIVSDGFARMSQSVVKRFYTFIEAYTNFIILYICYSTNIPLYYDFCCHLNVLRCFNHVFFEIVTPLCKFFNILEYSLSNKFLCFFGINFTDILSSYHIPDSQMVFHLQLLPLQIQKSFQLRNKIYLRFPIFINQIFQPISGYIYFQKLL